MHAQARQAHHRETQPLGQRRHSSQLGQRIDDDHQTHQGIDNVADLELFHRDEEARVDRLQEQQIESPLADQFGKIG